jgi:hypothetical protein
MIFLANQWTNRKEDEDEGEEDCAYEENFEQERQKKVDSEYLL